MSKNVKKLPKSFRKIVKKLSKRCQNFFHPWKKTNKNNGSIGEKVRLCNSKKSTMLNSKKVNPGQTLRGHSGGTAEAF
jgi:mRNA-degrading endonuclease RelE of RelBE toxin-antitoxin system